jgi:low affinity Fe/Cu permease
MDGIGRALVIASVVILVIGLALMFADRVPFVGRLPGDLTFGGDGWRVYVPIATSIVVSLVLTVALSLFAWLARR